MGKGLLYKEGMGLEFFHHFGIDRLSRVGCFFLDLILFPPFPKQVIHLGQLSQLVSYEQGVKNR